MIKKKIEIKTISLIYHHAVIYLLEKIDILMCACAYVCVCVCVCMNMYVYVWK